MRKLLLFLTILGALGCQSQQEKNMQLIGERSAQLKFLSSWKPTWCRVEARLTQPALSRYREMFGADAVKVDQDTWPYTWKAYRHSCEIMPLDSAALTKNHQAFLEAAMCILLQVHWVNSPFAELNFTSADVVNNDKQVQIRIGAEPSLGLFLDPDSFVVETKTKSRGVFKATYHDVNHQWLPSTLQQTTASSTLLVDGIEYGDPSLNGRPSLRSFWISVGDVGRPLQHTHIALSDCKNF